MRRIITIIYGMLKNKTEYVHPKELHKRYEEIHRERLFIERGITEMNSNFERVKLKIQSCNK